VSRLPRLPRVEAGDIVTGNGHRKYLRIHLQTRAPPGIHSLELSYVEHVDLVKVPR
jgi:hypothetical protein